MIVVLIDPLNLSHCATIIVVFTDQQAELLNGRVAMLGLLTMLCIEAQFEKALL